MGRDDEGGVTMRLGIDCCPLDDTRLTLVRYRFAPPPKPYPRASDHEERRRRILMGKAALWAYRSGWTRKGIGEAMGISPSMVGRLMEDGHVRVQVRARMRAA